MRRHLLLCGLALGCVHQSPFARNQYADVSSYAVPFSAHDNGWNRRTLLGSPVLDPGNQIDLADLDAAVGEAFARVVALPKLSYQQKVDAHCITTLDLPRQAILERSWLGVVVPLPRAQDPARGWYVGCAGAPVFPSSEQCQPELDAEKPGIAPLPCPCARRAVAQDNAVVTVPQLADPRVRGAFVAEIVRLATSCNRPERLPR